VMLLTSSLYCRFGVETDQCCCNAASCAVVLNLRVASGVALSAACTAGLEWRVASGVAMHKLILQVCS